MEIPLWTMSERERGKLAEQWLSRVGPTALARFERSVVHSRRFVILGFSWLVVCIALQIVHSAVGVAVSCLLWLPILYYAIAGLRSQIRARWLGGQYAGFVGADGKPLPASMRMGPEGFDRQHTAQRQRQG